MLEVTESKLAQYVIHNVRDTLVLGDEAFSQGKTNIAKDK